MRKISDPKKLCRVIATWLVTGIMISVFVLDIITVALANDYADQVSFSKEKYVKSATADIIHFLNTGNSDCIILESNGRFAMIDSGEGNNNPRKKTTYTGYGDDVLNYLTETLGDESGKIHLDFILATHMHYDHSGNFEAIINNENVSISKAYLKKYSETDFTRTELTTWDNYGTYLAITDALEKHGVPVADSLPTEEFTFGDFTIRLINHTTPEDLKGTGDNANSIGVKITKGDFVTFLAADFTGSSGLEEIYAQDIGDVDILKIGHHGYYGSSSKGFLEVLKPEYAICTNYIGKIYPNVKWNLTMVSKSALLSTHHRNGIMVEFSDSDLIFTENIM